MRESFQYIREDLRALTIASYLLELVDEVTQLHQPHKELFDFIILILCEINHHDPTQLIRYFEIKILHLIGLFPNFDACAMCSKSLAPSPLLFSLRQGGLVCSREQCRNKCTDSTIVSAGCVASIKFLRDTDINGLERFTLSKTSEEEMHSVVNRFIVYQLNHELRSMKFMREVHDVVFRD